MFSYVYLLLLSILWPPPAYNGGIISLKYYAVFSLPSPNAATPHYAGPNVTDPLLHRTEHLTEALSLCKTDLLPGWFIIPYELFRAPG